jgi:hypothetical protein
LLPLTIDINLAAGGVENHPRKNFKKSSFSGLFYDWLSAPYSLLSMVG